MCHSSFQPMSTSCFGEINNNNNSFVCRRAPGRSVRHHALNDAQCCLSRNPREKRANRLVLHRWKKADGLTLVPWQSGKSLCWDDALWQSNTSGAATELAASRKEEKYARIGSDYPCANRSRNLGPDECVSLPTLYRSLQPQAMTGKELFCSREFRCWCNATTLYCYMTPCQPVNAQTDDLYPILYYLNF